MSEDGKRREPISAPRVKAIGALTIVGIAMFIAILVLVPDPDGTLWFFGGLMLLSATAFWTLYFLDRKRGKG